LYPATVFNIFEHIETEEVWLQGHLFAANASLGGLVPEADNEVTMIVNIIEDDIREVAVQALEMIPLHDVLRHRVLNKVLTISSPVTSSNINRPDEQASGVRLRPEDTSVSSDVPSLSAPSPSEPPVRDPTSSCTMSENGAQSPDAASTSTLICRRIYFKIHRSASHFEKINTPPHGGVLRRLLEAECGISKASQQSCKRHKSSPEPSDMSTKRKPLFFADICHGAGGASLAARYAGFTVAYACDICLYRHETFKLNHSGALLFKEDINNFLRFYRGQHADCIHFSMPCTLTDIFIFLYILTVRKQGKTWSAAHTRPGKMTRKTH
jgi:hypothetical protein